MTDQRGEWHRLHPLSPLVRSGRSVLAVLALIAVPAIQGLRSGGSHLYEIAVPVLAAAAVCSFTVASRNTRSTGPAVTSTNCIRP